MEGFDFGLLAILLAAMVGATQARVLFSSGDQQSGLAVDLEPERDAGLHALPAIPKAGVPVFDFSTRQVETPIEAPVWDAEPVHRAIQYRFIESSEVNPQGKEEG